MADDAAVIEDPIADPVVVDKSVEARLEAIADKLDGITARLEALSGVPAEIVPFVEPGPLPMKRVTPAMYKK